MQLFGEVINMIRSDILRAIAPIIRDKLVVCNIGLPSQELHMIDDQASNFYMLGTMGLASSIGLGLAIAQEKTVISIDGDGSILTTSTSNSETNFDTQIHVYQGTCDSLIVVGCDDNSGIGNTSEYSFLTVNGVTYYIFINGNGTSKSPIEKVAFGNSEGQVNNWQISLELYQNDTLDLRLHSAKSDNGIKFMMKVQGD